MTSPYLHNGIPINAPINVIGPSTRPWSGAASSLLGQNVYSQPFFPATNPMLDYSLVKPIHPSVAGVNNTQSQLWMGKERDNTWLQLPVCPVFYRFYKELEAGVEGVMNYNLADPKDRKQPECSDPNCHSGFAHPPANVMKHVLTSGYVVCCQSFVFATKNGTTAPHSGCVRGEDKCRYFHPPENLAQIVINAGRNNKRLRSEIATKLKMSNAINAASLGAVASSVPYQLQNPYSLLPQTPTSPPMNNINSVLPNVDNSMPNLIPERMPSYSNRNLSGSGSTILPKNPSPIQNSFRNLPHHASPAIDYRQPSPPGEKMGKEDDFHSLQSSSRKRMYHNGNKNVSPVDRTGNTEGEKEKSCNTPTTKESPLAKRRHGDTVSTSNTPKSISTVPTSPPNSICNSVSASGEVYSIPNLVSPAPTPIETAALYSKAWAQQMKILQQNQTPIICSAPSVNTPLTNQFPSYAGIGSSLVNGISQVGTIDVDAYNAYMRAFVNQSVAASTNINVPPVAYNASATTQQFANSYHLYDPTNIPFYF